MLEIHFQFRIWKLKFIWNFPSFTHVEPWNITIPPVVGFVGRRGFQRAASIRISYPPPIPIVNCSDKEISPGTLDNPLGIYIYKASILCHKHDFVLRCL